MTKIREIREKFNGTNVDTFIVISRISKHNSIYAQTPDKELLFGKTDSGYDKDETCWYLTRGELTPIFIGFSYSNERPEIIHADIGPYT